MDRYCQQRSIIVATNMVNMFLKDLWRDNKKAAVIFMLFIAGWFFINIKQGAVATPMLQYGMYSEKYHTGDTLHIIRIYLNNQPLDFSTLSMSARDQLQVSLENYTVQRQVNERVFNTMHRILSKVMIGNWMKEEWYINNVTDQQFTDWYKILAERITGQTIVHLSAFQQKYVWQNSQLIPIELPVKLNSLVAF